MEKTLTNTITTHLNRGDSQAALKLLITSRNKNSNDAQYWELLALAQGMSGNNIECKSACIKAIELNPDNIGTHINLGVAQQNLGFLEETEATLKHALSMNNNHPQVQNNLGALYILKSDFITAKPYIEKAISVYYNYSDAHSNLGEIYKHFEENENAIQSYLKSIELNANNINAYIGLGTLYTYSGQYDEARVTLTQALQLQPQHPEVLFNLGFLNYQMRAYDEASKYFESTIKISPEYHNAIYLLSAITDNASPDKSPAPLVTDLFNHYAENFDNHLVNDLEYKTPSLMYSIFKKYAKPVETINLLDLGCGTGISSEKFRTVFTNLVGIDLSEKMLTKAKEKNIYNELHNKEISSYLESDTLQYDLVIASDVFIYIGNIADIVKSIYNRQCHNGYFIFSIEKSARHDTFNLRKTGRYSHNSDYIETILGEASYKIIASIPTVIRKEKGKDIDGIVYLSQK